MSVGWILHKSYIDSEPEGSAIIDALQHLAIPHMVVDWSWSTTTVKWPYDTEIVGVLGTIAFVRGLPATYDGPPLYPFFDSELHYYSKYLSKVPSYHLLNYDGVMLPFHHLRKRAFEDLFSYVTDDSMLLKPDFGLKQVETQVVHGNDELSDWVTYCTNHARIDDSSLFWIFEPKRLNNEYRFVVVNGQVISGSQYLNASNHIDYSKNVPEAAKNYAQSVASLIRLEENVYTLDVVLHNHDYNVVELNALSTSGLYLTDKVKVMEAATQHLQSVADSWKD